MTSYIIAASKSWFYDHIEQDFYKKRNFHLIKNKNDLNLDIIEKLKPRYIFFPHWNWIVPAEIYTKYECVVFHTAPLPYGRGGSPIQNLIIRGYEKAPVCALKMTDILDGGPIYCSEEISLKEALKNIFHEIAERIHDQIQYIIDNNPKPEPQSGKPVYFRRLKESDNEIHPNYSIGQIYDRIRMLDGQDYPKSYITFGDYRLELSSAERVGDEIFANVQIRKCLKHL